MEYLIRTIENIINGDDTLLELFKKSEPLISITVNSENAKKIKSVLSIKNQWVKLGTPIPAHIAYNGLTGIITAKAVSGKLNRLPHTDYIPYPAKITSYVDELEA
jgi:hypothetical protein